MKGGGASPHWAVAPKSGVWGGSPKRYQSKQSYIRAPDGGEGYAPEEEPPNNAKPPPTLPTSVGDADRREAGDTDARREGPTEGREDTRRQPERREGAPRGTRGREERRRREPDRREGDEPRGDGSPSGARKKNTPRGQGRLVGCGHKAADGKRPLPTGDTALPRG